MPKEQPGFQPVEPVKKDLHSFDNGPFRMPSQLERLTPERAVPHAITLLEERVRLLRSDALHPEEVAILEGGIAAVKNENTPGPEFIAHIEHLQEREARALQRATERRVPEPGEDEIIDRMRAHLTMYTALLQKIRELGESH